MIDTQVTTNLDYSLDLGILGHNYNIDPSTCNIVRPNNLLDKGENSCPQMFDCILYKKKPFAIAWNKRKFDFDLNIYRFILKKKVAWSHVHV